MTGQSMHKLWRRSNSGSYQAFYQPGSKLPSVRDLALEAGVNPNTMQKSICGAGKQWTSDYNADKRQDGDGR